MILPPKNSPLLLGTQEHGSTSRKFSFSLIYPFVEEDKESLFLSERSGLENTSIYSRKQNDSYFRIGVVS